MRPPNPLFTGREDILQELGAISSNTAITPYQEQCRIVISEMGGQGKSEICLQLAHRLRHMYVIISVIVDMLTNGFYIGFGVCFGLM
jgi:hypothetical protein